MDRTKFCLLKKHNWTFKGTSVTCGDDKVVAGALSYIAPDRHIVQQGTVTEVNVKIIE